MSVDDALHGLCLSKSLKKSEKIFFKGPILSLLESWHGPNDS